MEAVGGASAIVGLAVPVFKCAKELRDRIKLVRLFYPLYPLRTFSSRALMIILFLCSPGCIGKGGTLGSTHRIRKGYQPPRVTLQQQQGPVRPA